MSDQLSTEKHEPKFDWPVVLNVAVFAAYSLFALVLVALDLANDGTVGMLWLPLMVFGYSFLMHVNALKGKDWVMFLALTPLFPIAIVTATRLAKPGSFWFKRFYAPDGENAVDATERFTDSGQWMRWAKRTDEIIAGESPDDERRFDDRLSQVI